MNTIEELQKAALEVARAFEVMKTLSRVEQGESLRAVSAILIDMRRATDDLARRRY